MTTVIPTPTKEYYKKKYMIVMFTVGDNEIEIVDTDESMAATEAYNEYLRGGFIKWSSDDNEVLINASRIDSIMCGYVEATQEKGKDEFCNADCDCAGGK